MGSVCDVCRYSASALVESKSSDTYRSQKLVVTVHFALVEKAF